MHILGIDPGLNITGYGMLSVIPGKVELIEAGVIRTAKSKDLGKRLKSLHADITEVIQSLKPDAVSLEELYSHYERVKTAIIMGHARGVICLAAAQLGVPITHYGATKVKKVLTGNGRAPKPQVQLAVARHLNMPEVPDPPDVADALGLALCHYFITQRMSDASGSKHLHTAKRRFVNQRQFGRGVSIFGWNTPMRLTRQFLPTHWSHRR